MKYFLIEKSDKLKLASGVNIGGSDARHIKNVLRLGPGDDIGLFDGTGTEYEARIKAFSRAGVEVVVTQRFQKKIDLKIQLNIAQAFLKDRKMDGLVRQLTELGAGSFLPFISHRSVPRPDKRRLLLRAQRWEKIARESLKQCRRGHVMKIEEAVSFEHMLNLAADSELKIAFWEDATEPIQSVVNLMNKTAVKKIFTILGPEGGFTSDEMNMAKTAGFVTASLGPRVLRAETATITACALLQYLFGDIG
jgi:16S rRNA (uracil1498-N3)-methyltransferase